MRIILLFMKRESIEVDKALTSAMAFVFHLCFYFWILDGVFCLSAYLQVEREGGRWSVNKDTRVSILFRLDCPFESSSIIIAMVFGAGDGWASSLCRDIQFGRASFLLERLFSFMCYYVTA